VRTEDPADHLADMNRGSGVHHRRHRLVFRPDPVRVGDDDHATTGYRSGELHPTATGREHKLAGCGRKVDASMSGGIGGRRLLESMEQRQLSS
jgi:hypothetical protein